MVSEPYRCPKCGTVSKQPGHVVTISEVAFVNNLPLKTTFNAQWNVKEVDNVIRMLSGKLKQLTPPFKVTVKVDSW
ncbi:MAG: hypothetical protein JW839_02155 [Candidatus Lokiarchaeota archaeon]|nr:hypothetical protein [Candidatus Lokiarchaeota archaeon]